MNTIYQLSSILPLSRVLITWDDEDEAAHTVTHNMLSSNIKGVANGFPLVIQAQKVIEKEADLNPDFLRNIFPKIEWRALVDAARAVGYTELLEKTEDSMLYSDDFLSKFHHALLEIHLKEGSLFCPETDSVSKGIPFMLLHEDEV